MREIRFRRWDTKYRKMEYCAGAAMHGEYNLLNLSALFILFSPDYVLQQFTGLKDELGQDIYEGDILNCPHRTVNKLVEVTFADGAFLFEGRFYKEFIRFNSIEIAGNIFENPELMATNSPPIAAIPEEDEDLGLETCEQCGEEAWDGSICHSCGAKDI